MIENEICNILKFLHFSQFSIVLSTFFTRCKICKTLISIKVVLSLKVIELQRFTIPHFKALEKSFDTLLEILL